MATYKLLVRKFGRFVFFTGVGNLRAESALGLKLPWRAVMASKVALGLRCRAGMNQDLFFNVPGKSLLAAKSHVPKQTGAGGTMADLDIADGPLARLDAIEKVPHVVKTRIIDPLHLH